MNYNKGTIDCKIESVIQEIERLTWENDGKQPTIIAIIPIKLEKMSMQLYETIEVKIIYQI